MKESQMIKAMAELTKEVRELRGEIADLKSSLSSGPSAPLAVTPWLRFEAMESLARAEKPMSTEEIAQKINERRGMGWVEEKTSRASVSRAISELVEKELVMQKRVGRRVFYGLTGKAQVLCSEGKALEEAIKGITKKVIEVGGRKYSSYMMSIITSETRKDAKSIADVILGDEHKRMKGEISMRSHEDSSHRCKKSEISLLLLP